MVDVSHKAKVRRNLKWPIISSQQGGQASPVRQRNLKSDQMSETLHKLAYVSVEFLKYINTEDLVSRVGEKLRPPVESFFISAISG